MFLLRAAVAAPGPMTSNLPKSSLEWLRTPQTDKDLRRKEVVKAISASSVLTWPLLPTCGPAYLTRDTARYVIIRANPEKVDIHCRTEDIGDGVARAGRQPEQSR